MAKKTSKQILKSVTSNRVGLQDPKVVEKKNRRDLSKTLGPKPNMEREVYDVIDWMREGYSNEWCTQKLRQTINDKTGRVYSPRFVENIVTASNQLINQWYRSQIYQIENVHITRYNQIVVEKLNKKYDFSENMPEWLRVKLESDDLMEALNALKQKETLLGMHRKTFKLTINTQNNINIVGPKKVDKDKIDLTKLTLEEQIELMQLIEVSSRTEDEVFGVKLHSTDKEKDVEQEVEVIVNRNIDHIEPFSKPNPNNQGSTLDDIKTLIQQRLLQSSQNNKQITIK